VFTLRELNGMSIRETSEALDITESNVKVRFIRAKGMLQQEIRKIYSPSEVFEFNLIYCDKMVENVMAAIRALI
jgi:RNA polymerase sigma-70 factor (ECF subfamily)